MCKLIHRFAAALAFAFTAGAASAGVASKGAGYELQADSAAITIIYINGINNDSSQTADSSDALIATLKSQGLPDGKYNLTYFYNSTEGKVADDAELLDQAKISDAFLGTSQGDRNTYYQGLGAFYNSQNAALTTLSGTTRYRVVAVAGLLKKRIESALGAGAGAGVVLVPHSQGNFYVEAVYAMLLAEGKTALLKQIKVAGVASVAATTPSDRYITHANDRAISALNAQTHEPLAVNLSNYHPLPANETACIGGFCGDGISWAFFIDATGHGFQQVYLNPSLKSQASGRSFPKIIYDYIVASLGEIEALIPLPFTVIQPSPSTGKDIWTTSVFSFAPGGGGPGGGLNDDTLRVGGWADEYRSLLQFDISDPALPKQPKSVVLRLHDYAAQGVGTTPMTLFRITQFWDWTTQGTGSDKLRLWWADQPTAVQVGAAGSRPATLPAPTVNAFYDIDITDIYASWQADPTQNFGLELRPTLTGNYWNLFYSSDYIGDPTQRPQLIISGS